MFGVTNTNSDAGIVNRFHLHWHFLHNTWMIEKNYALVKVGYCSALPVTVHNIKKQSRKKEEYGQRVSFRDRNSTLTSLDAFFEFVNGLTSPTDGNDTFDPNALETFLPSITPAAAAAVTEFRAATALGCSFQLERPL